MNIQLEATLLNSLRITWEEQLEDKTICQEKNKIDTGSINENHKEFIKSDK